MHNAGSSGLLTVAVAAGGAAFLVGLGVLLRGLLIARRHEPRRNAWVLLALALAPLVIGGVGTMIGMVGTFDEVTKLGPAVTPRDMSDGVTTALATAAVSTLATGMAMVGGIAALIGARD